MGDAVSDTRETFERHLIFLLAAAPAAACEAAAAAAVVVPAVTPADGDMARPPHSAPRLGLLSVVNSCDIFSSCRTSPVPSAQRASKFSFPCQVRHPSPPARPLVTAGVDGALPGRVGGGVPRPRRAADHLLCVAPSSSVPVVPFAATAVVVLLVLFRVMQSLTLSPGVVVDAAAAAAEPSAHAGRHDELNLGCLAAAVHLLTEGKSLHVWSTMPDMVSRVGRRIK